MRTQHRGSRVGQHRPEYGEHSGRRSRRAAAPARRGWVKLLPLTAFLAVGAVTVWMAASFNGGSTDISLADSSTSTVANNNPGGANPGTGGNTAPNSGSTGTGKTDGAVEQTKYGPLTAADKDFLNKVWQAGSWEGPTGRQAQERAGSQKVKDAGLTLASDHAQLDAKTTAVAQQLGHTLPTEPNADQKKWMAQLGQVSGEEYDRLFADLLRAAHGKVFAVVADIRTGTKNGMIRALAQTANAAVLKHMTVLEGTGMVTFSKLPDSKVPTAAVPPATGGTSGNNGAQSSSGQNPGAQNPGTGTGNQLEQVDPDLAAAGNQTPAKKGGAGMDNYIIVIMLGLTGIISAITYRQLHRRRR